MRPQFNVGTLFWLLLVIAAFLGGRESMKPTLRWLAKERISDGEAADKRVRTLQRALQKMDVHAKSQQADLDEWKGRALEQEGSLQDEEGLPKQ